MTKIAITALHADSTPYGNAFVTVKPVGAGAGLSVEDGLIVEASTVKLDGNGEGVIDLTPSADTDPPGSFYAFTVNGSSPTIVRYLEVPAPNGVGEDEIPYQWDDADLQRLAPSPPTLIPAPASGDAGDVLTIVDDGDGKRYVLAPPEAGGATVHNDLTGRSAADAHPIPSITGLAAALAAVGPEWGPWSDPLLPAPSGTDAWVDATGFPTVYHALRVRQRSDGLVQVSGSALHGSTAGGGTPSPPDADPDTGLTLLFEVPPELAWMIPDSGDVESLTVATLDIALQAPKDALGYITPEGGIYLGMADPTHNMVRIGGYYQGTLT